MREHVVLFLRSLEILLTLEMEPVRRFELHKMHKVWTERLKALR
jgi:hypothetical protein